MESLSGFATGVGCKIGELLVGKIAKQSKHLIHPNKSINILRAAHEQLSNMKQTLEGQVNVDTNKGLKIAPDVKNWLREVESIEAESQQLYEDEVKRNQFSHYSLSKQAAEKRDIVLSLIESRGKLQIISYPASPLRAEETFTANIKGF